MEALRAESLGCGYNAAPVVQGFTAQVGAGEVLFILGPVGSGKTTLLRCMLGVLRPLEGRVLVAGEEPHRLPPRRRARLVAYVPQHPRRAGLTVYEAAVLGRYPYRGLLGPRRGDEEKVWSILRLLGLEELAHRRLSELSGGQLQKAMIARALVQEPRLLLLDEPTSSLDPRARLEVMQLLRRIAAEEKVALVVASHSLDLAARYADKIVMIGRGRVVASGGPEVLTPENIEKTYGLRAEIIWHRGRPVIVPAE